jgi:serine/threonine protein kinase
MGNSNSQVFQAPGEQFIGCYSVLGQLGSGAFGTVYQVKKEDKQVPKDKIKMKVDNPLTEVGEKYALKQIFCRDENEANRALNEIISMLRTPHTDDAHTHTLDAFVLKRTESPKYCVCIVMEYVDGGSLRDFMQSGGLRDEKNRVRVAIVIPWIQSILKALERMHDRGIIHRDIKPDNILLTKDGRTKITDFGIATLMAPTDLASLVGEASRIGSQLNYPSQIFASTAGGTPLYMPPEARVRAPLGGIAVSGKTDVFAVGCILLEVLYGRIPGIFADLEPAQIRKDLRHEDTTLVNLALRMTALSAEHRPTAAQLLNDDTLAGWCRAVDIDNNNLSVAPRTMSELQPRVSIISVGSVSQASHNIKYLTEFAGNPDVCTCLLRERIVPRLFDRCCATVGKDGANSELTQMLMMMLLPGGSQKAAETMAGLECAGSALTLLGALVSNKEFGHRFAIQIVDVGARRVVAYAKEAMGDIVTAPSPIPPLLYAVVSNRNVLAALRADGFSAFVRSVAALGSAGRKRALEVLEDYANHTTGELRIIAECLGDENISGRRKLFALKAIASHDPRPYAFTAQLGGPDAARNVFASIAGELANLAAGSEQEQRAAIRAIAALRRLPLDATSSIGEALATGWCTTACAPHALAQKTWVCVTCRKNGRLKVSRLLCASCARHCHEGHEVVQSDASAIFCECRTDPRNNCMTRTADSARSRMMDLSFVRTVCDRGAFVAAADAVALPAHDGQTNADEISEFELATRIFHARVHITRSDDDAVGAPRAPVAGETHVSFFPETLDAVHMHAAPSRVVPAMLRNGGVTHATRTTSAPDESRTYVAPGLAALDGVSSRVAGYAEFAILEGSHETHSCAIGFVSEVSPYMAVRPPDQASLRQLGDVPGTAAIHGDSGNAAVISRNGGEWSASGWAPVFDVGDVIGAGILGDGTVFFTLNGQLLGYLPTRLDTGDVVHHAVNVFGYGLRLRVLSSPDMWLWNFGVGPRGSLVAAVERGYPSAPWACDATLRAMLIDVDDETCTALTSLLCGVWLEPVCKLFTAEDTKIGLLSIIEVLNGPERQIVRSKLGLDGAIGNNSEAGISEVFRRQLEDIRTAHNAAVPVPLIQNERPERPGGDQTADSAPGVPVGRHPGLASASRMPSSPSVVTAVNENNVDEDEDVLRPSIDEEWSAAGEPGAPQGDAGPMLPENLAEMIQSMVQAQVQAQVARQVSQIMSAQSAMETATPPTARRSTPPPPPPSE